MGKINIFVLFVSLVYVGNWNRQPVYVDPNDVSGVQAITDLGFSGTIIKLKMGNEVYSKWYPSQIVETLNNTKIKRSK